MVWILFQSDRIISNQLYAYAAFLPPNVLKALDELNYSVLEMALNQYAHEPGETYSNDLANLAGPLWHYITTLNKLADMANEELL